MPAFTEAPSVVIARSVLLSDGVLAVPTDTVYGVAGLAQSISAVRRLYSIKKRDPLKPVAICVGDIEDVYKWAQARENSYLLLPSRFGDSDNHETEPPKPVQVGVIR